MEKLFDIKCDGCEKHLGYAIPDTVLNIQVWYCDECAKKHMEFAIKIQEGLEK